MYATDIHAYIHTYIHTYRRRQKHRPRWAAYLERGHINMVRIETYNVAVVNVGPTVSDSEVNNLSRSVTPLRKLTDRNSPLNVHVNHH